MTRRSADSGSEKRRGKNSALSDVLAKRFVASLLPNEREHFSAADVAEAAQFTLEAARQRDGSAPVVAIESAGSEAGLRHLRVALINDDMPFLVDSIAAAIASLGLSIHRLVHPVVNVRRSAAGKLTAILDEEADGGTAESIIYLETERADAKLRRQLASELAVTLGDVAAAVADWPRMRGAMEADGEALADVEGGALLGWLAGGMLTQLGHVTRRRDGSQAQSLGICRRSARELLAPASYERAFAWFDKPQGKRVAGRRAPLIVKANVTSRVHRRVPLDLFIAPVMEDGELTALSVHAGVWTSAALAAPPEQIPRMRQHLAALTEKFGFDPAGHAGKALVHALTALPHDLLIGFAVADLERIATAMMSLVDRPRPKLALVEAPLARHLFAFVWMPRDNLSTAVRLQVQGLLEQAAGAPVLDWSLSVEGGNLALLRFVIDIREGGAMPDEDALDARLKSMLRGWSDAVEIELASGEEAARAAALAQRYAELFPPAYRTLYGAAGAAIDIRRLRTLSTLGAQPRDARLHRLAGEDQLRLKLYQRDGVLTLSDAVPALENFGFRVIEEVPTSLDQGRAGTIHDFLLGVPEGVAIDSLLARADAIERAIAAVLNGAAEDDPFNRLIITSGLSAREAELLRAWFRYLRQTGMSFAIQTVVDALKAAPAVTRGLIDTFVARHDPDFAGKRDAAEADAAARVRDGLTAVTAINDDRLLRAYQALVGSILRTNAFAPQGAEALAFKIDSAGIPGLPLPLPWREVWVYSRRVEGIHLRAGPIARGGLRWSDRRDDFRTEVLGLMKAQRVKNAVIVPTGAKGGFYPKQLPNPATAREAWLAEGTESYRVFIRSLLSLTDNIVGKRIVHPPRVMIRDGEDPYFVVAADKGTASFSDIANAIAESQDFWLDDAFASGGSKGYDHKAMGITARGAWLSVQRHFLEMGIDVQNDTVRVAGCGDMSGDVFGNGMLLSKAIQLVAAFDHRHIFLDPNPDPATSWAERARLFALPRSSWADYDAKLISPGGGVFPRSQKAIPLSAQVQAMLGLGQATIDPDNLIRAILKAKVDLMWFGGIGTYVKAGTEAHGAVGDPGNDALRVDGAELGAKVVGEGANLGVTQAGRIEFALHGGRINTDFIDNSAGVDCSDNEVNIKIALASAKRAGRLTEPARVKLLSAMTEEVAAIVLEDNRLQALALSIAQAAGPRAVAAQLRLIEQLEEHGQLDRRTQGLAEGEVLSRRALDGQGLTRPELAVLLSSAKLALQEALENSTVVDDPGLDDELLAAFPAPMRRKYRADILGHRLRREIIATKLANRIVNRMGVLHPFELVEEEGTSLAHAAAAFAAAERLLGMPPLWEMLESAPMPESARVLLFERAALALRTQMADLVRVSHEATKPTQLVAELGPGMAKLSARTGRLLNREGHAHAARMHDELLAAGAPEEAARAVGHLFDMDGAVGLSRLARDRKADPVTLTTAFSQLGDRLGLDWAQMTAARMNPSDPWERLLVAGLARDFQQMRLDFLRGARAGEASDYVAKWADSEAGDVRQFRALIARAQNAVQVSPAMLAQIASQARSLLSRQT